MTNVIEVGCKEKPRRSLRELGASERLFHLCSQRIPTHFCIVGEVRGRVEPAALRSALESVRCRHPLLRASIGRSVSGTLTAYASTYPIELRLLRAAPRAWTALVERELSMPFADDCGPLLRANVICDDASATIILTFHHTLTDGLSGVRVLSDLLKHLAVGRLDVTDVPECVDTFAEKAVGTLGADVPPPASPVLPATPSSDRRTRVSTLAFNADETARLLRASRAAGTTLHGALCASLVSIATRDADFRILNAMNLRETVDAPEDVCSLLITAVPTCLAAGPDTDFWNVARCVSKELASARAPAAVRDVLGKLLQAVPHHTTADEALAVMGNFLAVDALVTNLGALKIDRCFGDLILEAVWGPIPASPFDVPVYGATGHAGSLRIIESASPDHPMRLKDLRSVLLEQSMATREINSAVGA